MEPDAFTHAQHRAELSVLAEIFGESDYTTQLVDPQPELPLTSLLVALPEDDEGRGRTMSVNVMPLGDGDFDDITFVQFFVAMPFAVPDDRRIDVAAAATKVNGAMALGHFGTRPDVDLFFRYMYVMPSSRSFEAKATTELITMMVFHQEYFADILEGVATSEISVHLVDKILADSDS
jgi:hypothetical protein